jgi:3-hydroxymyristoyl/3-hydroxydecanoyl-(acyl carrier protein) dehydratase/1-acyl-sn-glycerol-3-phosphate acyltransferase
VRNGQAGFFTDAELAASGGVLWDPAEESPDPAARLDAPAVPLGRRSFSRDQVRAFAEGRMVECFGPAYALAETHTHSPRIQNGQMCLLGDVAELDPTGGPWGRGYMRIETDVSPDDWFFAGHFKHDPCMPGTLMVEGCLQAMAFYLAAMGYSLDKDGWRFEPVTGEPYTMRCRGQVTPSSKRVTYEIFVSEVHDGPIPTLYADLLGCVDGVKAFHCRRMGLSLVPDWPIARMPELLAAHTEPKPVATVGEHRFDYASLLACAWGKPSAAFGPAYAIFDGVRRCPRLPGPPYHFISRVTRVEGAFGVAQAGAMAEMEYDVPPDAWYFDDNGCRRMPYAVLLEAALQPCGWLATYSGVPLRADEDLFFRNLDGTGTLFDDLAPDGGTLRTTTTLTSVSQAGGMTLVAFEVACFLGDRRLYEMTTMFGFFPAKALQSQVGLPPTPDERAAVEAPSDFAVDLTARPARHFTGTPRMPAGRLLMLDRVTGYWPTGGKAGLGRMRAEKDVAPDEWFFKAHFYQDPVQPGSLGIEAMIQLLQFYMLERGMGEGLTGARFETLMHERPLSWKYRGQVVPRNRTIVTELEITEVGTDARGPYAIADAWLWVDGLRIYAASNLGMRLVAGDDGPLGPLERTFSLDPAQDTWLADHSPTYAVPALPLMSTVELLAEAARARRPGAVVTAVRDLRLQGWVDVPAARLLRTTITAEDENGMAIGLALSGAEPSRFDPVANARVLVGAGYGEPPAPWAACEDGTAQPDPYADGSLFHGPAFQVLRSLSRGRSGASAVLDAGAAGVPVGLLHPALLDGVTHALPNDSFETWAGPAAADQIAFPSRLVELTLFGPAPTAGPVRAEVRFAGLGDDGCSPLVHAQLIAGERVWAALSLEMRLFPKGPLGRGARLERRAFLRDRAFVRGLGLSDTDAGSGATRLTLSAIAQSNWFPGFLGTLYGAPADRLAESAVLKDHAAAHFGLHPGGLGLSLDGDTAVAWRPESPLNRLPMRLERASGALTAYPAGPERLDVEPVRDYWRRALGRPAPPVEDLFFGLAERFVSGVHLEDPEAYRALQGRSVLYLANHQVGIESPLFSVLVSALGGVPTATLAKAEHRESWLGQLLTLAFAYPGLADPELILFFDRQDQGSLLDILGTVRERLSASPRSLLVHAEGTRSTSCREPVRTLSAAFLDLAVERAMPIVPVRFVGGLPVEPAESRLEFPLGYGRQGFRLGRPIAPEDLAARPLAERKALVLDRLGALAPADETPAPGDPAFAAEVARLRETGHCSEVQAVLRSVLAARSRPGTALHELLSRPAGSRAPWSDPALGPWLEALHRYLGERPRA